MPGIINGLFAGRSGINSSGSALGVLADNIANSNTTGFKSSRANFSDLLASSLGGGGSSSLASGNGANLNSITTIFSQGTFEFTGRGLDLGIDGNGFFIVERAGARLYSRAGNMQVDADGILLDQNGNTILGFPSTGAGGLQELNVNNVSQSNVETENVTIAGNLDSSTATTAVPGGTPTFQQLADAATFSTFVDVFDTLGAKHTVTVYFFHTTSTDWAVRAYVDGGEITAGTPGEPSLIGNFTMTFNSAGARTAVGTPDFSATPAWSNGAAAAPIDFVFDPFSGYATASAINSIVQDGSGTGSVVSFSVEEDGTLFALLNNGQTSAIGTIAMANFANPEGLRRAGDSLYLNTTASGEPIVGRPATGQFGKIQSGALELSTADIADDFIKLISLQRGFQGSSRIISAISDLLTEITNIGR